MECCCCGLTGQGNNDDEDEDACICSVRCEEWDETPAVEEAENAHAGKGLTRRISKKKFQSRMAFGIEMDESIFL